jgi:MFS family permease
MCFLVGVTVLFLGVIPFAWLDEPRSRPLDPFRAEPDLHAGRFWPDMRALLKGNGALRQMLVGQCFISLATMAQPFFIIDYSSRFHVSSSAVGDFTTIGAVLGAFGSFAWGAWGDYRGNKGVLILSALLALAAAIVALIAPASWAFYAIFAFSALSSTGIGIGTYNIVMEFAGESRNIPFHTAVFNAVVAPFRTIAPLAGGLLADHFGYGWVFALSAIFTAAGLVFTVKMVEPRKATGGGQLMTDRG